VNHNKGSVFHIWATTYCFNSQLYYHSMQFGTNNEDQLECKIIKEKIISEI